MRGRLLAHGALALVPWRLKPLCYRLFFGYEIGRRVRIGLSIVDATTCHIGDDVRIGHLNLITGVNHLAIGDHATIDKLNIISGGREVRLGRYVEILRLNEITSIQNPRIEGTADPCLVLDDGVTVTASHKIDFTDRVEIGRRSVLGGRLSSLWTHNRQRTMPVRIGSMTYVGSEIRMAPGSALPSRCIVGLGAVVTKPLDEEYSFIAGVPARVVRPLGDEDRALLDWRSRPDLPDDL